MNRFFVFYVVACLILFASLTGLFQALGIHEYYVDKSSGPKAAQTASGAAEPPPFTMEEFIEASPKVREEYILRRLPPMPLIAGYYYQVGSPTPIYSSDSIESAHMETLPTKGVFELTRSISDFSGGWTHVIVVNDGLRNYTMYMFHKDLESWSYYGQGPPLDQQARHEEMLAKHQARVDERQARLEAEYQAALAAYREAEKLQKRRNPLREGVVTVQESLARFDTNGFLFNALLAGALTFFVALFVGTAGWLRSTRAWQRDFGFDDIDPYQPQNDEQQDDEYVPPPDNNYRF